MTSDSLPLTVVGKQSSHHAFSGQGSMTVIYHGHAGVESGNASMNENETGHGDKDDALHDQNNLLDQFVYAYPQAFSLYQQQVQQLFHAQQTSDGSCGIAPQKHHKHQQTPRIQTLLAPQCDSLLAGKHPEQGQTVRKGHGVPQACISMECCGPGG